MENEIFYCQEGAAESLGYDLNELYKKYQTIYIKHKILDDSSGKSYAKALKALEKGEYDSMFTKIEMYKELHNLNLNHLIIGCPSINLENRDLSKSKYRFLKQKGDSSMRNPMNIDSNYIKKMASMFTNNFEPSDFDHPLYKTRIIALITLFAMELDLTSNRGLKVVLPPHIKKDLEYDSTSILHIMVDGNDVITVDGNTADITHIEAAVRRFIIEKSIKKIDKSKKLDELESFKGAIGLDHENSTSYQQYIGVYSTIIQAFDNVRNDLSNAYFGSNFTNLDLEVKNKIVKIIPLRILESEPFQN
ncbi:MAG: hypothetical protein H6607_00015 [Flavobacteriales bacterium]|nr:hypothetical protein [Flavobacteriales bacterium]